jgi:hypothetical protein
MGLTKAWLMEQAENERFDEVRQWLKDRLGREPTVAEVNAAWGDFELHEAYEHAASGL